MLGLEGQLCAAFDQLCAGLRHKQSAAGCSVEQPAARHTHALVAAYALQGLSSAVTLRIRVRKASGTCRLDAAAACVAGLQSSRRWLE